MVRDQRDSLARDFQAKALSSSRTLRVVLGYNLELDPSIPSITHEINTNLKMTYRLFWWCQNPLIPGPSPYCPHLRKNHSSLPNKKCSVVNFPVEPWQLLMKPFSEAEHWLVDFQSQCVFLISLEGYFSPRSSMSLQTFVIGDYSQYVTRYLSKLNVPIYWGLLFYFIFKINRYLINLTTLMILFMPYVEL